MSVSCTINIDTEQLEYDVETAIGAQLEAVPTKQLVAEEIDLENHVRQTLVEMDVADIVTKRIREMLHALVETEFNKRIPPILRAIANNLQEASQ